MHYKIKQFIDFLSHKIIYIDDTYTISYPEEDILTYPYELEENEKIVSFQNDIFIVYNTKTSLLECYFDNEPGYVQSQYYLKDFTINDGYIKYFFDWVISNQTSIKIKNSLIIGLCLGNMPNALIQKLDDKIDIIDCVDSNRILCKMYKKFFCVSNKIKIHNEFANYFVEQDNKLYDYIFIDIPCLFIDQDFLNNIYKITQNNSVIHINLIGEGLECLNVSKLFRNFKVIDKNIINQNYLYVLKK